MSVSCCLQSFRGNDDLENNEYHETDEACVTEDNNNINTFNNNVLKLDTHFKQGNVTLLQLI